MKKISAAAGLMITMLLAGCSGGGTSQSTPVSGVVADGYLQNALVFLDKNSNYQLDDGEPSARTDQNGAYTLNVAPEDIGSYPIVALALAGETIDMDNPGQRLDTSYVLCTPAAGVSGTVSNFISPISTLLREKLVSNPGMTLDEAMVQLRNQMNLPAGVNMMGDYVAGSVRQNEHQERYQTMYQVAQQLATLMGEQSGRVMNGRSGANMGQYRSMLGEINSYLPQIADNAMLHRGTDSAIMDELRQAMITRMTANGGFGNYSTLFQNMTSHRYFWNYSGGQMRPHGRM